MDAEDQQFGCSLLTKTISFVEKHKGHTAREIAVIENIDNHYEFTFQILIAKDRGLIHQGAARLCNIQHNQVATWWPVE